MKCPKCGIDDLGTGDSAHFCKTFDAPPIVFKNHPNRLLDNYVRTGGTSEELCKDIEAALKRIEKNMRVLAEYEEQRRTTSKEDKHD